MIFWGPSNAFMRRETKSTKRGTGQCPVLQIKRSITFHKLSHTFEETNVKNIVAAFRGMHVSRAKHSYASVTDGRTDRQTDGRTTDKVIPMCRYASQATQQLIYLFENHCPKYYRENTESLLVA